MGSQVGENERPSADDQSNAVSIGPGSAATARPSTWRELRTMLGRRDFRRLLAVRIYGQIADGVFQASLAGTVMFNPDRQNSALQIALGFAVLLLPYSVLAPFGGVLIDRFSRRNIMVVANLLRALIVPLVALLVWAGDQGAPFFLVTLLILSVNRFLLSALSAAQPYVVEPHLMVTANSLIPTLGTVSFAVGGGIAVGLRGVVGGGGDAAYATITALSLVGCLIAALYARGFRTDQLGPDEVERASRQTVRRVVLGMAEGLRHLADRRPTGYLLGALTVHRVLFGVLTITGLLMVRNYFDLGLPGLGALAAGAGVGAFLAAAVTPPAIHRLSRRTWVITLMLVAAVSSVAGGATFTVIGLVLGTFVVALGGQGVKIVSDTSIQTECDPNFQGRVFSVNDTLFNTAFVIGLIGGALSLPSDGRSYAVLAGVAVSYLIAGLAYGFLSRRWLNRHPPSATNSGDATAG